MAVAARWIRMEPGGLPGMRAACAGFAREQAPRSAPAVLWAREGESDFAFALVAPLKFAPGRRHRWQSWALAPLIATHRRYGVRAYLEGDRVCVSGRGIASCEARQIGACAAVISAFLARQTDFMDALRDRIEAQHGWQFDHSWPTAAENGAIAGALAGEPAGAG